jgi:polysaccharide biosynthesis protein PslH
VRIVLVLTEPPLPFGNAAGRWFHVLVRGLVARGHEVTTFATASSESLLAEARALRDIDLRVYPHPERRGLSSKWESLWRPFSYPFSKELRRDLERELARGFSVLHMEPLFAGWVGLEHARRALVHVHFLYGIDLARTKGWRKHHAAWAEKRLLRAFPRISTITPRLADEVRRLTSSRIDVVPFAIDATLYEFFATPLPRTVSLIGSFSWEPSHSAAVRLATRLWPRIRERVPGARLRFIGRSATKLASYASQDIEIHADVPDVRPFFASTGVLLYPLEVGSGIKVKVVEALLQGVPVVTTREGIEGLPLDDAVDDDDGLVARTVALLEKGERSREGRALVERACAPSRALDAVIRIHEEIARA